MAAIRSSRPKAISAGAAACFSRRYKRPGDVAREHLVGQRRAFRGGHRRDRHLRTVRPPVSAVAVAPLPPLEQIGAGVAAQHLVTSPGVSFETVTVPAQRERCEISMEAAPTGAPHGRPYDRGRVHGTHERPQFATRHGEWRLGELDPSRSLIETAAPVLAEVMSTSAMPSRWPRYGPRDPAVSRETSFGSAVRCT